MKKSRFSILAECAIMIALGTGLSMIKIFELPWGGSITLISMLPVCLLAIRYGVFWGLGAAYVYAVLQLLLSVATVMGWGLSTSVLIACLLLDYILAYTVLGFAGMFRKHGKVGIITGVYLAMGLRLLCHIISGVVLFAVCCPEGWSPLFYSIVYNGAYMVPETIITVLVLVFLASLPQTKRILFR
ncbi:MAG TPA: proton-coupled thiamine transporter YuaJ [Clostridiales bacterium]|nr:proton-coupled thiamine transporter YuaJ [Clostridiales bacterium]